jgi:hypothetical protein
VRPLSSQGHQARELVDLSLWNPETGYRYEWRQRSNSSGGSATIVSGVGTEVTDSGIRVRLVFRPPMQVLLESMVVCHN